MEQCFLQIQAAVGSKLGAIEGKSHTQQDKYNPLQYDCTKVVFRTGIANIFYGKTKTPAMAIG
jgi:hypothetical protein